jgi:UDP-N-acetylglucosamine 2-epimerase (non-hydrolysing)
MHRVENLRSRDRVTLFAETVCRIAAQRPVHFVVHEPTRQAIERFGVVERLRSCENVTMTPLLAHNDFVTRLREAPFVITDGGSIQEECAMIGVPTLLWRDRTEWEFGVGENVVIAHYDVARIDTFLCDFAPLRRAPAVPDVSPSEDILNELLRTLGAMPSS